MDKPGGDLWTVLREALERWCARSLTSDELEDIRDFIDEYIEDHDDGEVLDD